MSLELIAAVFLVVYVTNAALNLCHSARIIDFWHKVEERQERLEKAAKLERLARYDADIWMRVACDALGRNEAGERAYKLRRKDEGKADA